MIQQSSVNSSICCSAESMRLAHVPGGQAAAEAVKLGRTEMV